MIGYYHKFERKRFRGLLFCVFFLLMACNDSLEERIISFIGDSEVAKWDLQRYFPTWRTENLGKGSTGLAYIKENAGCMRGKIAVVQFGTNDIGLFDKGYADEYVAAIAALGATQTFVISIFPRSSFSNNTQNEKIIAMNDAIHQRVDSMGWTYINVYPSLLDGDVIYWDYYTDGLHLSPHGYAVISEKVRNVLGEN